LLPILIIEFVLKELNLLDQVQHGMRSVLGLDVVIPEHGIGGRNEVIFISDNQLSDHGKRDKLVVPPEPPKHIYLLLNGGRLIFDNFDFIYGMFIGKSLEEAPDVLDLIFEPSLSRAFQATRSFKVKGDLI
jgi:hypothetical protein